MLQKILKNILSIKTFATIKIGSVRGPNFQGTRFSGSLFLGYPFQGSSFLGARFQARPSFFSFVLIRSSLIQLLIQKNINGFYQNCKTDVKLVFLIFHESQSKCHVFFTKTAVKNFPMYTNISFHGILSFTSCFFRGFRHFI